MTWQRNVSEFAPLLLRQEDAVLRWMGWIWQTELRQVHEDGQYPRREDLVLATVDSAISRYDVRTLDASV